MNRTAIILSIAACSSLAACATRNTRDVVGDASLHGEIQPPAFRESQRREAPLASDARAPLDMARADWKPIYFLAPIDGVAAYEPFARPWIWTDETVRQRHEFPSALSALELSGKTAWEQRAEAASSPFLAFYDFLAFPYRMYNQPPWRQGFPLEQHYWRAPATTPRTPLFDNTAQAAMAASPASPGSTGTPGPAAPTNTPPQRLPEVEENLRSPSAPALAPRP